MYVFVVHCQIHFQIMWILHIHVVKYVDYARRTPIQSLMTVIISVHCYVILVLAHNVLCKFWGDYFFKILYLWSLLSVKLLISEIVDVEKLKFMLIVDSQLQYYVKIYAQKYLIVKIIFVKKNVMLINVSRVKSWILNVCTIIYLYFLILFMGIFHRVFNYY